MESRDLIAAPIGLSAVLVVLALAAAGCGGAAAERSSTGSDERAAAPSPASSALIARADPICKRLNTQIAAHKDAHPSLAVIARQTPHNIELERQTLAELAKIAPPSASAHDWQQMLADRRALADQLVELVDAATRHDAAKVTALEVSKKRLHLALSKLARGDGFKDCGEVG